MSYLLVEVGNIIYRNAKLFFLMDGNQAGGLIVLRTTKGKIMMSKPKSPGPTADEPAKALDSGSIDVLGTRLRGLYDEYLSEPMPRTLLDLMAKLDEVPAPRPASDDEAQP